MPVALATGAGEPSHPNSAEGPFSIGYLLYIASVGLIAAGIVAVFFGTGFSLLVPTGAISDSANLAGPAVTSPLPPVGQDVRQTFLGQASARQNDIPAQSSVALPPPAQTPAMERKDDAPHLDGIVISKAPTGTSAASADAPLPAPNSPVEPAALPAPGLSNIEITELLEHGDALLRNGDVASARLFYERAAGAGNGRAALRL